MHHRTACQSECIDGSVECVDRADEGRRRCCHQGDAGWLASCCRRAECSARSSKPADTHWRGPSCWQRIQVSRTCPCKPWTWRHAGGLHISGPTGTETVSVRARSSCADDPGGPCVCRLVRGPAARGAISSGARTMPRVCSLATMRAHAQCPAEPCAHCEAAPWLSRADGRSVTRDVAEQPISHATGSQSPCMNSHRGQAYGRWPAARRSGSAVVCV